MRIQNQEPGGLVIAPAAALLAALVCAGALGLRTLTTVDLGYHLAYGDQFLETGRIVDHNPYIYTLPSPGTSPGERPAPGPGCWYDQEGRYRFPNANWLSQIVMAAVHRMAGIGGLCVLTSLLVVATSALMLGAMRRLRVTSTAAAAGVILFGLVSFSRLNLRPELFGHVALALELLLLAETLRGDPGITLPRWRTVAAIIAVQIVFVNLHSYFLLGVALTGAILADRLVRGAWHRFVRRGADRKANALRNETKRLVVLQVGMGLACFLNPWGWRLAALPLQTLIYLRENGIGGQQAGAHPWSHILEFRETIRSGFPSGVWGYAFLLLLVLAGAGSLGAILRRRGALFLMIAGMMLVSLAMRRNVGAGALVIIPASLAALGLRSSPGARAERVTAALVLAAASVLTFGIASSRFYREEGHPIRFGIGISRIEVPLEAAGWLDEHLPGRRVWCDLGNSSNLHFFTHPHREVPILSNTWAYPPEVMAGNRRLRRAEQPYSPVFESLGVDAALLSWQDSLPLALALVADPGWAVVQIDGRSLLFIRTTGDQENLARRSARLLREADPASLIARYARADNFIDAALLPVGQSLATAGLFDQALALFQKVVEKLPDDDIAWRHLGRAFAARGAARQRSGEAGVQDDFAAAERCLAKARRLNPEAGRDREIPAVD